jgi:FkbM family methyltransferase
MNRKHRRSHARKGPILSQRAIPGVDTLVDEALGLHRVGKLSEAERLYRKVLTIDCRHADSLHLLGLIAHQLGRHAVAAGLIGRAIAVDGTASTYQSSLGVVLKGLGRLDAAISAYKCALCVAPDYAEAHFNLGNASKDSHRLDAAVAAYTAAVRTRPYYVEAHSNLGIVLRDRGHLERASGAYKAALCIKPDYAEACFNLGIVLKDLGRFEAAADAYKAALRIKPDYAEAYSNLLFSLHYRADVSGGAILAEAQEFAEQFEKGLPRPSFGNSADPDRRLRVGYVSGDFRRHPVSYFLTAVLPRHDRTAVEVFCYSNNAQIDDVTDHLRGAVDHWRSIAGLSEERAAEMVSADDIDILVDLSGHTALNRLPMFARKPAPVQVTWLGYPGTTGLTAIDYRLVDGITDPELEGNGHATETLYRLPDGFLCYWPPTEAPEPSISKRQDDPVTFGSFNNSAKLSPATLDVWAELLDRLPGARLVLKGRLLGDRAAAGRFLEPFEERGIALERIVLAAHLPSMTEHLTAYRDIDIGLDPFPYNGTTTTCEAMWMGVPVVALCGERHSGRVGASLLTRVGLEDLIAEDVEDYIRIAVDLANDHVRREGLRQTLRLRMAASPLCDAPSFTRRLETAYRDMWRRWCKSVDAQPKADAVRPLASELVLEVADGIKLAVPQTLSSWTTYVLLEQERWLEKEVDFLRRWLRPGMTVIDIGANVGVYSLPMARWVAPDGKVFAYEPASSARRFLERSRDLNGANNLTVVPAALSDRTRKGWLAFGSSSELNSLGTDGPGESVQIGCLDDESVARGWSFPDFVKIDAEGEEQRILTGGDLFFERNSPLVMYEVKAGTIVNTTLRSTFHAKGYGAYRCLAGAPVLVPVDGEDLDPYELNLFAAKLDRVGSLIRDGVLVDPLPDWRPDDAAWRRLQVWLKNLAFGAAFGDLLTGRRLDPAYGACLAAFVCWLSADVALAERCGALDFAVRNLTCLAKRSPTPSRLVTLGRIAWEAGRRAVCVGALRAFIDEVKDGLLRLKEPFWPATPSFDGLSPGRHARDWLIASAVEQLERSAGFSSLFVKPTEHLVWLCRTPFASAEMHRRQALVKVRAGEAVDIPEHLLRPTPDHRNASFWKRAMLSCGRAVQQEHT